jgi:hypothetical protein
MEQQPDARAAFEDGVLVFLEDEFCGDQANSYEVTAADDGAITFVGDDECINRLWWLSGPSGDLSWTLGDQG